MKLLYRLLNKIKHFVSHWTLKKIITTVIIVVLFIIFGSRFSLYVENHHWDNRTGELYESLIFTTYLPNLTNIISFYNYFLPSDLPKYRIEIDADALAQLTAVIPTGFDDELSNSPYVPATFFAEGKEYRIEIKNRGLLPAHWKYRKKSWHVRFRDEPFHGYTELNFILPEERGFLAEDFGYYIAQKLGLTTLDSSFIRLKINNQSYGAYWLVEQWGPDFLERHQLTSDANLFRGDHDELFAEASNWETYAQDPRTVAANYYSLDQLISCLNQCNDQDFYALAQQLIDLDSFIAWQVQASILGDDHQDYFHNNRFYFNPVKGQFEFFPWDVNQFKFAGQLDIHYNPLVSRLLTVPEIQFRRNQVLWAYVTDQDNVADDLAYYQTLWHQTKSAFYRDRVKRYSNNFFNDQVSQRYKEYQDQYSRLERTLAGSSADQDVATKLHEFSGSVATVDFVVKRFTDVMVEKISHQGQQLVNARLVYDSNRNNQHDASDQVVGVFSQDGDKAVVDDIGVQLFSQRQIPQKIEVPLLVLPTSHRFFIVAAGNQRLDNADFKFTIRNALTDEKVDVNLTYYDPSAFDRLNDILLSPEAFVAQNSIFVLTSDGQLILPRGSYRLNQTTIIPRGTRLTIQAGVTLVLGPDVSLISYSPIEAQGSASAPVLVTGLSGSNPWGGVVVVNAGGPSSFSGCTIRGGSGGTVNGVTFTGMLSIFYGDATIDNCIFENAQDDDALNVKFGAVSITDSTFRRQSADAIDLDFTTGVVAGNIFTDNGNDAIDISGSSVRIENNQMVNSGDKGVSVGEDSQPTIVNNLLIGNTIGIEVKDLSEALIINNTIANGGTGINLYQKKEIFGGGIASVVNTAVWGNQQSITLDDVSTISVSNSLIEGGWNGEAVISVEPELSGSFYRIGSSAAAQVVDSTVAAEYNLNPVDTIGYNPDFSR